MLFGDFLSSPYFSTSSSETLTSKSSINVKLPIKTSFELIKAFKPLPVMFSKFCEGKKSRLRSFDLFTIALPIGCVEFCSTEAARANKCESSMLYDIISSTSGFPMVIVPVLSNAAVSILPAFSNVSPFLIKIPNSAALPTPTVTAVGVARPNAQGHATTSIEIRHVRENSNVAPKT